MAVPRPLLLTLLGTVLLAATFFAATNARNQASDEPAPAPAQQAEVPEPAPNPAEKSQPRADKAQGADKTQGADRPRADRAQGTAGERRAERPRTTDRPGRKSRPAPSPAPAVKRAIAGDRLVVLFFYKRGASDDRRVARSVSALRGRTRAAVFSDRIANLAKYGQIATSVGVTRSPSIVIIGKGNRGRLIEGYVDSDTLAQRVADAR